MNEQSTSYIDRSGDKIWYLPSKGKDYYHRLDGPAIELEGGTKQWWVNDELHRLDGPAIEWIYGSKEWYVNDKQQPTKEIEDWLEENNIDLSTEEDQMAFKLRWL